MTDSANTITALLVEPGKAPKVVEIENNLHGYYKAIGCVRVEMPPFYADNYGTAPDSIFIINEEGKIDGSPYNRGIVSHTGKYAPKGQLLDLIFGSFLIVGIKPNDDEEICSLPAGRIEQYKNIFRHPEALVQTPNGPTRVIIDE